jgi:serine/threonine protein kinase
MGNPVMGQVLLDQFKVEAFIDSGGMGAVFRVRDLKRNVHLAMKTLHSELAEDASIFKRFRREAVALSKLSHPNIVRTYGLYQAEEFAFLLQDFIDGMSLKNLLEQRSDRQLSIQETMTVMNALCSALGFAHANGIIHCDIKPANVMLDRSGHVYLTDFGIARHADSTTTTLAHAGAPAYMSPEQIKGKSVNAATDIYSLGILLYEVLTGKKPFSGEEQSTGRGTTTRAERLRSAHLKLPPPDPRQFNPAIPEALAGVILRAMEKEPRKRFQDVHTFFQAAIQAVGQDEHSIVERLQGIQPPQSTIPQVVKKEQSSQPNPMVFIGIGLAALVLIFMIIGNNTTQTSRGSYSSNQSSPTQRISNSQGGNSSAQPVSSAKTNTPVVRSTNTPKPASASSGSAKCPGTPSSRLKVGMKARVSYTDGTPLRLRREPFYDLKKNYIRDLSEGTRFTVIDGPVCEDGYVWWKIRTNNDHVGWSAEGDSQDYFMEPYNW